MNRPASSALYDVKVYGELAMFTRPESKVERVSYEVMTPSAALGILRSIFWKPEFLWEIEEIWVLNPIKWLGMTTNEINHPQSVAAARRGEVYEVDSYGALTGEPSNRTQRHNVCLRDVAYVIRARMIMEPHARDPLAKYLSQFERRLRRGACYKQPCFGQSQYTAYFEEATQEDAPLDLDLDLGSMHWGFAYVEQQNGPLTFHQHGEFGRRVASGRAQPIYFHARVECGVLKVPSREDVFRRDAELLRGGARS